MTKPNKLALKISAAVLALILIFVAAFGTVALVRRSRSVVSYRGVTLDAGEYAYLATYAKAMWFSSLTSQGVTPHDAKYFYAMTPAGGTQTYGEKLDAFVRSYIARILISASYFDSVASLTSAERKSIREDLADFLDYRADGDRRTFDAAVKKYGFTYADVKSAAPLVYKAARLSDVLYGSDYSGVADYKDFADSYLSDHYVHVNMLVIRTEDTFVLDEAGNRVQGNGGIDERRPYSSLEKEQVMDRIAALDAAIEAKRTGVGDTVITPEMFAYYLENYDDGEKTYRDVGYYFGDGEIYTREFAAEYPDLVRTAFSMDEETYEKVWIADEAAFVYLYKQPVVSGAYGAEIYAPFFTRFSSVVASEHLADMLSGMESDVTFRESAAEIDLCALPYQTEYFV